MAEIANGSNRGQAAVVTGFWGLARLRGDVQAHGAIVVQSLAGSLQYGSDAEKEAAAPTRGWPPTWARPLQFMVSAPVYALAVRQAQNALVTAWKQDLADAAG